MLSLMSGSESASDRVLRLCPALVDLRLLAGAAMAAPGLGSRGFNVETFVISGARPGPGRLSSAPRVFALAPGQSLVGARVNPAA